MFLLIPIFFGISFVYSSVGFGGGSSYIAILVISGVSIIAVPTIALPLNIAVSGIALFTYIRAGHFSLKLSLPFLSSIPFAFYAGTLDFDESTLAMIFVVALLASSVSLFMSSHANKKTKQEIKIRQFSGSQIAAIGTPVGAVLGTIAGLVGIGGGIWLSPLLILSRFGNPKNVAATASFFILANSTSGFAGHAVSKAVDYELILPLLIVVIRSTPTIFRRCIGILISSFGDTTLEIFLENHFD